MGRDSVVVGIDQQVHGEVVAAVAIDIVFVQHELSQFAVLVQQFRFTNDAHCPMFVYSCFEDIRVRDIA
jgi:hypothetical protein